MKKNLLALTASFIVTVLAVCVVGWNCSGKVFASEVTSVTELTYSDIEYNQFEMPVIAISTASESEINSDEDYTDAQISIINDEGIYEMSDMDTSIKLRGNSSKYAPKASYKMKFKEKQNLLDIGDGKGKPWLLIANLFDGSLLRNFTAYHFADLLTGITYSPNCRSVELYINGEYEGVYLLCEDVNISKNRIAITEEPDEVENNGYLVEMSRYDDVNKFDVDTASYIIKSDLSETESIKEQQVSYISGYINESYNALKNGKKSDVKKYIDLDSLVDIYIGNEIVKNVDAGWDSFYMYKDSGGKLCFGPMWDFDLAMGNANCVKGFDSWAGFNPYHVLNVNANSNPWFCHALSCEWFRELVKERWNELQDEINALPDTVINEAESKYKSYCRNFEKWDVLGKQVYIEPAQISALPTFKDHYTYLADWLRNRVKWLTEYYKSKDFENGIFVDETGNNLSADSNMLEMSSILALANSEDAEITYEMSLNTGTTISIENGGSESWHVQAVASGFMLEKDEEYVLSFDYKCSEERPISFAVQQNHEPWSPYFTGELIITNELQHYEGTFTATANDSNCAFAVSLGSNIFNGTVVTIDNMSLVKKSATEVIKGDIDGNGTVNIADALLLAVSFNSAVGDDRYNPSCDLNNDGAINIVDIGILAGNFNKTASTQAN